MNLGEAQCKLRPARVSEEQHPWLNCVASALAEMADVVRQPGNQRRFFVSDLVRIRPVAICDCRRDHKPALRICLAGESSAEIHTVATHAV